MHLDNLDRNALKIIDSHSGIRPYQILRMLNDSTNKGVLHYRLKSMEKAGLISAQRIRKVKALNMTPQGVEAIEAIK